MTKVGDNMAEEQEGVVIAVNGRQAQVRASRHSDCENCGACPGNMAMVLEANNAVGAQAGQRVLVRLQEVHMVKAAFIVYVLPLAAIAAGAAIGWYVANAAAAASSVWATAGGVLGLVAALVYVRFYDRRARQGTMQPCIVKILGTDHSNSKG